VHQVESSEKFAIAILNSIAANIAVIDHDGVVVATNEAWQNFAFANPLESGITDRHTAVGTNYLTICQVASGESQDGAFEAREGIIRVLKGDSPNFTLEYPCHSAHEQRWFILSVTPVGDGSGRVIAVHTDITARKLAELDLKRHHDHLEELVAARTLELEQSRNAAETANRAKSNFLANMSHELRTPLHQMMGMTDLVMRKITDPKQLDQLGKAKNSSVHLLTLIDNMLNVAQLESDKVELAIASFKLSDVTTISDLLFTQDAEEKGLRFVIDFPPALASMTLTGDVKRLNQILISLVANAIKFTSAGSITLRTSSSEETASDILLKFEVEDTGIGISEEAQSRIFNLFEQADGSMTRRYGGVGVGLTISKKLVKLMGGDIGVKSTVGQGSTFWFTVRLKRG
jgi:signal transduction histidine kinase